MATIDTKRDKKGNIIGYRLRACVGRENNGKGKQVWRTTQLERPEKYKGKTQTKGEISEIERLAANWEKAQKDDYSKTLNKVDKKKIGYKDFVETVWFPNHVMNGSHSPNGISFFRSTVKTSVDFFGNKKMNQITAEEIKKYLNYLSTTATGKQGQKYTQSSQQHHFATLRNVLHYAWRFDYISENPCQKLESSEIPSAGKTEIDFLLPEQAQRFIHCLDAEYNAAQQTMEIGTIRKFAFWRLYGYLLITAGLRRGEAVALKWSDVDMQRLNINVSRSVCSDKTQKNKMLIKDTKTGQGRLVPILDEVKNLFSEFRAIEEAYFDCGEKGLKEDTFVFCSESDPTTPVYCTTPTRFFQKFVKRNNLPDVSPHDLRHTAASLALESGANMKQIAQLMGHSDIGTTAKFYAALTEQAQRRTVEGIGNLILKKERQNAQSKTQE